MERFRFSGFFDVRSIEELKYRLIHPKRRGLLIGFCALMLVCAIVFGALGFLELCSAFAILAVAFAAELPLSARKVFQTTLARAQEVGRDQYEYVCTFDDDTVVYENAATGGNFVLNYTDIVRCYETENLYFLITKTYQMAGLNKSDILPEQRAELIAFLAGKGVKVPRA